MAYIKGIEPFTRKRSHNESLGEFWQRFLKDEDFDVGTRRENLFRHAYLDG